jgi:hypothetical protein
MSPDLSSELKQHNAVEVDLETTSTIPTGGGVYFLCSPDRILYIGISENIRRRINNHRRTKRFSRLFCISEPGSIRRRIESTLISHYLPTLNSHWMEDENLTIRERSVLMLRGNRAQKNINNFNTTKRKEAE